MATESEVRFDGMFTRSVQFPLVSGGELTLNTALVGGLALGESCWPTCVSATLAGAARFLLSQFVSVTWTCAQSVVGPAGGSAEKPVGTVHIAVATPVGTEHRQFLYPGDRERVRWQASQGALDMVRRVLMKM